MHPDISVESVGGTEFRVIVTEGATKSAHHVTLKPKDYDRIRVGKITPADLVKMSFEFLLEHEPKESILPRFDLTQIAHYVPDFEREIRQRIAKP